MNDYYDLYHVHVNLLDVLMRLVEVRWWLQQQRRQIGVRLDQGKMEMLGIDEWQKLQLQQQIDFVRV